MQVALLTQIKLNNNRTKTNGVEIIFNIKQIKQEKKNLKYRPAHFEKMFSPNRGPETKFFLRLAL